MKSLFASFVFLFLASQALGQDSILTRLDKLERQQQQVIEQIARNQAETIKALGEIKEAVQAAKAVSVSAQTAQQNCPMGACGLAGSCGINGCQSGGCGLAGCSQASQGVYVQEYSPQGLRGRLAARRAARRGGCQ